MSSNTIYATSTTTAIAAASSLRDVAVGLLRAAPHRFCHDAGQQKAPESLAARPGPHGNRHYFGFRPLRPRQGEAKRLILADSNQAKMPRQRQHGREGRRPPSLIGREGLGMDFRE